MPPLNPAQRYQIEHDIRLGATNKVIALGIGCSLSTIEREIGRCGPKAMYRATVAQAHRDRCGQISAANHPTISPETWELACEQVSKKNSPEQVIRENHLTLCPSSIYRYLKRTGKRLVQQQLRHYSVTQKRGRRTGQMPWVKDEGVQSIRDRPQAINTRDTIGHLEADSIVGKRNEPDKILVIIDRASRFVRLGLVRHGTAAEVASLFAKWQDNNVGIPMLSVTTDQGYEFSALPKQLSGRLYACDPGKPYQKGQVEHVNKLIRQYIPKGVSLRDITQAKLDWVALQLNSRVRKRLGWKSPLTVLSEMTDRTVKSKANLPYCLETTVFIRVLLAARDQRVRGVIVNRLEVFGFERVGYDAFVTIQRSCNIAYQVFNKLGVVVCPLGDEFFIDTLQYAIQFTRRLFLGDAYDFVYRNRLRRLDGHGDV